ncbi:MAG TPA: HAD-IA family hydrolase [Vicinamibacterales bacterium]|nr:HAD-IA family hydrolase [Vicinamibacterales bacterium]
MKTTAVFFDVDFTLIHPGPVFRGEGYRDFCVRHGVAVDPSRFEAAVAGAAPLLDTIDRGDAYDPEIFVAYTRGIIEHIGGSGPGVDAAAREIYAEWAACQHFELYDDVSDVLRGLAASGVRIGLISNTQRCLTSFQSHFELDGLISVAVSSFEHGFMKPHASIFSAALARMDVGADRAMMVGDSLRHDVEGALGAGMRAVLLDRAGTASARASQLGVPVIRSLHELPQLL